MIPMLKSLESEEEAGKYNYEGNLWDIEKHKGIRNRINLIMSKQGFWTNLKPLEAGLTLYKYISERFDTYILTKARKECSLGWKEKVDWIHKYIGNNVNILVVTEKKIVMGDLLFDDYYKNATNWLVNNPNGRVLIPKRKSNRKEEAENKDERIVFWDDSLKGMNTYYQSEPLTQQQKDNMSVYDFTVPHNLIDSILKD